MQEYIIKTSSNICFGYLLELTYRGDSNKYPKLLLHETILRIILSIKDSLQQRISFETTAVVVMRVHCIPFLTSGRWGGG